MSVDVCRSIGASAGGGLGAEHFFIHFHTLSSVVLLLTRWYSSKVLPKRGDDAAIASKEDSGFGR